MRRLAAVMLLLAFGCSKETEKSVDDYVFAPVKAACRAITKLEMAGAPTNSVVVRELDVRGMKAEDFRQVLEAINAQEVHVWSPSVNHWLLVGRSTTNRVSLSTAMDALSLDDDCESVAELFANYIGTREEILPAFRSKLDGDVVPEWFVTKEIPQIEWLDYSGIDADILQGAKNEIRSMQVIRRLVLEGNMLAAAAKDKKGEAKATDTWARAALRNPRDLMLLERVDRLERNAKGFLEVGKLLQAMKCYETIILIQPKNAAAIRSFGQCLKKIGKLDFAEKVLKRADEIEVHLREAGNN